ncbi:MAG: DUF1667 domain-containing protein [Lachnospiraceae bacterium]|nr:DUF1667 domain-containing protein [Lachnospiraceae bacterium]
MENRELTCIGCPLGCQITVMMDQGEIKEVTGNTCPRGEEYARKEVLAPTRIVTSTVRLEGGDIAAIPVKTKQDIPKSKIFDVMDELKDVVVKVPVHIGDVVLEDVAGTGVPVIATKDAE